MKQTFRFAIARFPLPLTSVAAFTVLVLGGCSEDKTSGYTRLAEVPAVDPAAPANAPAMALNTGERPASPHGANPHAGMNPHAGAGTSTASAGMPSGTLPFDPPPPVQVRAGGNILEAAGVAFTVPEDWKQEQPSNAMRLAQYSIPGEAGAADLVLFYFGKGQGGDISSNVRRWAGQFTSDDPSTSTLGADVGEFEKDGLKVALVKTSGTYDPGSMGMAMGPAAEPKPNYALFGLVIEGGPEGSLFVKVTGPKATLDAQNEKLEAFAQSVRRSSFK